jgi:GNAT superfamily N-acetyltransferase
VNSFLLTIITRQQFVECITKDKADSFAKTFVAKADAYGLWDNCIGCFDEKDNLNGAIIIRISKRKPVVANLELLHTFAAHRKKGVAKKLCERGLEFAIMNDAEYFRVSAEPSAVEFYKKIGFSFWGKQKSNCQLSIFRINGKRFEDGIYYIADENIRKALFRKGKGGCIEVFSTPRGLGEAKTSTALQPSPSVERDS